VRGCGVSQTERDEGSAHAACWAGLLPGVAGVELGLQRGENQAGQKRGRVREGKKFLFLFLFYSFILKHFQIISKAI